jgi:EmrB/QacA subfamily drug resistance transporter
MARIPFRYFLRRRSRYGDARRCDEPTLNEHSPAPIEVVDVRRRLVTIACMMSAFMVAIEVTIVATAMPTIVAQLGRFDLFTWVFAAYILTSAVTAPVYGRLADLYGRKRVYYVGAGLFLFGSALCGFAPSMAWLIAFRTLQGLGAGALQPLTLTILGDLYRGEERARVQAWQSSVWGVAAIAGPVAGALIVEHLSWAIIFWINIPIGILTIGMLAFLFHEPVTRREHRIDYLGSMLLMLGAGAILLALVQANDLPPAWSIGLLIGGAGLLGLLMLNERRAPEPIVALALWKVRSVVVTNLGAFCIGVVLSCTTLFLPAYVQGVLGYGARIAGSVYAAQSIAWSVGSVLAARVMTQTSFRTSAAGGAVLLIAGALLMAVSGSIWVLTAGAVVVGVGMGLCNTTFIVACQADVGSDNRGGAVSSNLFLRSIGMAIGAGIGGAVTNFAIARVAPAAGDAMRQLLTPATRSGLDTDVAGRLVEAIARALQDVYLTAAVAAALALIFSLRLSGAPSLNIPQKPA